MNVYTYSEARKKLAGVLEQAAREGQVRIRRKDGTAFVIRPELRAASPLDVEGLDLGLPADEIVQMIRESRRTEYRFAEPRSAAIDWRDYVAVSPGEPAILRESEIPLSTILADLAAGSGPEEVARNRPPLTREDVQAALLYAAEQL